MGGFPPTRFPSPRLFPLVFPPKGVCFSAVYKISESCANKPQRRRHLIYFQQKGGETFSQVQLLPSVPLPSVLYTSSHDSVFGCIHISWLVFNSREFRQPQTRDLETNPEAGSPTRVNGWVVGVSRICLIFTRCCGKIKTFAYHRLHRSKVVYGTWKISMI